MEEEKVLINRTRVNKTNWRKLKLIAQILSEKKKSLVTREMIVEYAIEGLIAHYNKVFKLD
jgi:hypothetical protein